jgi:hypothetical protein
MKRIKTFKDIPVGTVFTVVKEKDPRWVLTKDGPTVVGVEERNSENGYFVKTSPTRSRGYSKAKQILLGFSDIVQVVAYPSEKASMHLN